MWWSLDNWFLSHASGQTDRQTYRCTLSDTSHLSRRRSKYLRKWSTRATALRRSAQLRYQLGRRVYRRVRVLCELPITICMLIACRRFVETNLCRRTCDRHEMYTLPQKKCGHRWHCWLQTQLLYACLRVTYSSNETLYLFIKIIPVANRQLHQVN